MPLQFTHPVWLLVWPVALAWVIWLAWTSDVHLSRWRWWSALSIRCVVISLVVLALTGLQWLRPQEGMNVFFLLDRSDSVPSVQQEAAVDYVNRLSKDKEETDGSGVIVFGSDAGIEFLPSEAFYFEKVHAVIGTDRTDLAGAIRLGTAAFPETGQKRLVLLTDGNENMGDAFDAVLRARPLGVTVDVMPLGVRRGGDVSVQRLSIPNQLKEGQTFEVKIYAEADRPQPATLRIYRNDEFLGEQTVDLNAGRNLFAFPQSLSEPGFYDYDVALEPLNDPVAQNNRASSFTHVRGDPRVLIITEDPEADGQLAQAISSAKIEVDMRDIGQMPDTLAEWQSYDAAILSNVAAGDLGRKNMDLLESAVRDFGLGLICVGGDQTYAAGGYRGTPLEDLLPVDMELSSKKVLPSGALVLVMHGMEFNNGNQVSRDIAIGALEALGPQDQLGVILWDGRERWVFPPTPVGDKKELGRQIAGMSQGDMVNFQSVLKMAHEGLREVKANLKHIVVFSDGDPGAPTPELMEAIVDDRITVSTVLISGHMGPATMIAIAEQGKGRFYDVKSPTDLPQIFIKEAAVILKSAIFEDPFQPQVALTTELVRGIGPQEYPQLLGYVATTPKTRAEIPLLSDKGDPVLAHWQFGLGRTVAFTSDARAKWAQPWLEWPKYRQFWTQITQWALRRVDNADFTSEVTIENGQGHLSVDAVDAQGNYQNFLNLQAVVVDPEGERQMVRLEQTAPGHYETRFPTRSVGAYMIHLMDLKDGLPQSSQVLGASINYSPEFNATEPNLNLLQRLADSGGGQVLEPSSAADNPFRHDRLKTFQPRDLWPLLLQLAIVLFPLDVGIRRIQLDREEWFKATQNLRRYLLFWRGRPRPAEADESLTALLARRDEVRSRRTSARTQPDPELFRPQRPVETISARPQGPIPDKPATPAPEVQEPGKPEEVSTTSRLLEAKRRAQQRKG